MCRLPRVFVEVEASADPDSSADWQTAGIGVRLTVPLPSGLTPQLDRLMQALDARQVPVWIATPLPQSGDAIAGLARRHRRIDPPLREPAARA